MENTGGSIWGFDSRRRLDSFSSGSQTANNEWWIFMEDILTLEPPPWISEGIHQNFGIQETTENLDCGEETGTSTSAGLSYNLTERNAENIDWVRVRGGACRPGHAGWPVDLHQPPPPPNSATIQFFRAKQLLTDRRHQFNFVLRERLKKKPIKLQTGSEVSRPPPLRKLQTIFDFFFMHFFQL